VSKTLRNDGGQFLQLEKCREIWLRYALNSPIIVPLNVWYCRVAGGAVFPIEY
jgi:hypothetical protein